MSNRLVVEMLQDLRVMVARNRNMLDDYRVFAEEAVTSCDPRMVAKAEALLSSHDRLNRQNKDDSGRMETAARTIQAVPRPRRAPQKRKRDWFDKMTDWLC